MDLLTCPCCGKDMLLNFLSQLYPDVVICDRCVTREMKVKWYVHKCKLSNSTKLYVELRNEFSYRVDRPFARMRLLKESEKRTKMYVVVQIPHNKPQIPLAEFKTRNEALAFVLIRLGSVFRKVTDSLWVDANGNHIGIEYF